MRTFTAVEELAQLIKKLAIEKKLKKTVLIWKNLSPKQLAE